MWPTVTVNKHHGGKLVLNIENESTLHQRNLKKISLSGQRQPIRSVDETKNISKVRGKLINSEKNNLSNLRKICKI